MSSPVIFTTPRHIHADVLKLRNAVVPLGVPLWVPVKPEAGSQLNECFFNVRNKVRRFGGDIVHGWTIWERAGLFVEAEFHAVWKSPANELIDISPKIHGESSILFIEDPEAIFDERTFSVKDNVRQAIMNHPYVYEFIEAAEQIFEYREKNTDPSDPRKFSVDPLAYRQLILRLAEAEEKMVSLPQDVKGICRCGSGKFFSECCQ